MKILLLGLMIGTGANPGRPTPAPATALGASACLSANSYTAGEIAAIKQFIGATDSLGVDFRASVSIPVVADSSIRVEHDSGKCARALATYNAAMDLGVAPASRIYLIRVGTRYVGSNPAVRTGGDDAGIAQIVMDATFSVKAVYFRFETIPRSVKDGDAR
ncbi:MAG: hypothetical protein ABJF01_19590 [bacterium]